MVQTRSRLFKVESHRVRRFGHRVLTALFLGSDRMSMHTDRSRSRMSLSVLADRGNARGTFTLAARLMLGEFWRDSKHSRFALVLESETLAVDADDDRVVHDTIEHCRGEHAVGSPGESCPRPRARKTPQARRSTIHWLTIVGSVISVRRNNRSSRGSERAKVKICSRSAAPISRNATWRPFAGTISLGNPRRDRGLMCFRACLPLPCRLAEG